MAVGSWNASAGKRCCCSEVKVDREKGIFTHRSYLIVDYMHIHIFKQSIDEQARANWFHEQFRSITKWQRLLFLTYYLALRVHTKSYWPLVSNNESCAFFKSFILHWKYARIMIFFSVCRFYPWLYHIDIQYSLIGINFKIIKH